MFSSSSFSYLGHLPFTAVSGAFRLHLSAPDCWVGDTGLKMQSTFLFLSWQTRLTDTFHKCSPSQCLHLDRKWQEEMGSMKHKEVNYLHLLQSNIKAEKNSGQSRSMLPSWKNWLHDQSPTVPALHQFYLHIRDRAETFLC